MTVLPLYWETLLNSISTDSTDSSDPLLPQSIDDFLFERAFSRQFAGKGIDSSSGHTSNIDMTTDELNALRYMCGYIPYKLLRKFSSSGKPKSKDYCIVLEQLRDESSSKSADDEDVIELDSRAWLRRVSRGYLFEVSDAAFEFFKAIEKRVRHLLPAMLLRKEGIVDSVKKEILGDEVVKGYWSDSTNEADCSVRDELLIDIVSLYVTIRGFSLAASWLEQYKREKSVRVAKSKALRKSINKGDQ